MAQAPGLDIRINPDLIPALGGAEEMLVTGVRSTLHSGNAEIGRLVDGQAPELLFDPQTAGGLLVGVPTDRADACVEALRALGYEHAAVIGIAEPMAGTEPMIRLGNLPAVQAVTVIQVPVGTET
jgi:selenide, water dikinase